MNRKKIILERFDDAERAYTRTAEAMRENLGRMQGIAELAMEEGMGSDLHRRVGMYIASLKGSSPIRQGLLIRNGSGGVSLAPWLIGAVDLPASGDVKNQLYLELDQLQTE